MKAGIELYVKNGYCLLFVRGRYISTVSIPTAKKIRKKYRSSTVVRKMR